MHIHHVIFAAMIMVIAAATPAMASSVSDLEARVKDWQKATCPNLSGLAEARCIADFTFAKAKVKAFEAKAKIVEVATSQKTKEQVAAAKAELTQLREAAARKFAELQAKYAKTAGQAPAVPRN